MPVLVQQFSPATWAALTRIFPGLLVDGWPGEVRPGDTLRFLRRERQGQGALGWALAAGHWGLVTTGSAAAEARRHVFQARVESLGAHRTYRDLLVIRRCVIPLAAYWDALTASPLPVRVLVHPQLDLPMFAAELHASILTPAGPLISCAVFTRPAPPDLAGQPGVGGADRRGVTAGHERHGRFRRTLTARIGDRIPLSRIGKVVH